jgi:hypothetical protein
MSKSKKVKVVALAKFQSILGGMLGLLAGIIYSFGGLIIDVLISMGWITSNETPGLSIGSVLAFGALFAMPIIAALIGLVIGIIEAVLFNIFARLIGGIEINL